MNAEIYKCSKVYSYSDNYRAQGTSVGGGQDEVIVATVAQGTAVTNFNFGAIQPFDLLGMEINIANTSGVFNNVAFTPINVGIEFRLNGQRPTDTIIVTDNSIPAGNKSSSILMGGFGSSYIDFTKSEYWRNITSMDIIEIVAYSGLGQFPSGPIYETYIGLTMNLYYKA